MGGEDDGGRERDAAGVAGNEFGVGGIGPGARCESMPPEYMYVTASGSVVDGGWLIGGLDCRCTAPAGNGGGP